MKRTLEVRRLKKRSLASEDWGEYPTSKRFKNQLYLTNKSENMSSLASEVWGEYPTSELI